MGITLRAIFKNIKKLINKRKRVKMSKSKGNNNWVTHPNYRWIDNFKSLFFIIIEIEIISNKYFLFTYL